MTAKTIIIGLDGARLDVLKKWCKEGHLPNIKNLIKNGTSGRLKSILPIHSFPAWTSLSTGCNPTNHGIYDILLRKNKTGYNRIPPNSNFVKVKRFWEILDEHGYTCAAINIPVTYPPRPLKNGVIVSSVLTPSTDHVFAHPEKVLKMLREQKYKILPESQPGTTAFIKETHEILEKQYNLVKWFMEEYNWDCVFWVIMSTEILHHHYATFVNPDHPLHNPDFETIIRNLYVKIDKYIGEIQTQVKKDLTIILVSDHGFTSYYGTINMNALLKKWGFLKTKNKIRLTKYKLLNLIKKHGKKTYRFLPKKIKEKVINITGFGASEFSLDLINWSKTKAYVPILDGQISINLQGREKNGAVPPEKYDTTVKQIIEKIKKEPELNNLIDYVKEKKEVYNNGKYFNLAPDIFIVFKNGNKKPYKIKTNPFTHKLIDFNLEQFKENIGYHTLHGIFIANGKNIKNSFNKDAEIIDIAPTILSLFNIKQPLYQDGKTLTDIFIK